MRTTWDALARADTSVYVGDPARAADELASLFSRLHANPRGGLCVEVGCGPGRMTAELAARFDHVLGLDVSAEMVARARETVTAPNVEFRTISGKRLDGVPDASADAIVCYLVLQHLPRRRLVLRYLHEFARVLKPGEGEAFVQVPVLERGLAPLMWRLARMPAVTILGATGRAAHSPALRGDRLTETELWLGLLAAGLEVVSRDEGPDAPYRYATDVFLRLRRG